jgi:hypothetical protein
MIEDKIRDVAAHLKANPGAVTAVAIYLDKAQPGYTDGLVQWTAAELEWLVERGKAKP